MRGTQLKSVLGLALLLAGMATARAVVPAETAEHRLVCAAAMQAMFGKPYVFVRTSTVEGITVQQFRNPENSYANSCYLEGAAVTWRTDKSPSTETPGRWRKDDRDDKVTWSRDLTSVIITTRFSDGSGSKEVFPAASLEKSAHLPR